MDITTIRSFFNPDDPFCYPAEWLPAMLAGFTAEQAAANDPLVLGEHWYFTWPSAAKLSSAPKVETPLCITGSQKTHPSEAGLKETPNSIPAREQTPRVAPALSLASAPASGLVVDFLNFTFSLQTDELLTGLRLLLGDDWQEMEKPFYGYRAGARCGNVVLLWAGSVEGMGVHVQLSGQGCREVEGRHSEATGGELDWRAWLGSRVKEGARFSQTHFAYDDLTGNLTVDKVTAAFRSGQCVTRFGTFEPRETFGRQGERTSQGFYFGKRAADTSICVYDKKLEQLAKDKGKEIDVEAYAAKVKAMEQGWTRLEIRNRDKRSHALVLRIVSEGWGVVAGVLRGYLDIRVPTDDPNKHRWEVEQWWGDFCGWAEKALLKVDGVAKTLQTALAWVDRQVGTVLAMVNTVLPDPVGFLTGVMERGAKRFSKRHLNMMSTYLTTLNLAAASAAARSQKPSTPG